MNGELSRLLRLAGPVIIGEIGWMSMGLVDTLMVGPLGPAAIGATGISSGVFMAIAIFGMGLMLGLDALVSRAFGAGDLGECLRWLHQGLTLAALVTVPVMGLTWIAFSTLAAWGLHADIAMLVGPYLRVVSFGTLPLLLYAVFRRYLQGLHVVGPIMVALVTANLVNAAANWALIHGHLGMPALGVEGAAWATSAARLYLATFLGLAVLRQHRQRGAAHPTVPFSPSVARLRTLVRIGAPAASQVTLEVGVFAAATALAGQLDPVSSAAHQIALNAASLAFMVPLGLASAGAVRVGHAVGAGDPGRAVAAGWTALGTSAVLMIAIGLVLFLWPVPLLRAFTPDPGVVEIGTGLLAIAAGFQLFDGAQAVATGVLRGAGDTRTPMLTNMVGHWGLGLPVGYVLCFRAGLGVQGLWLGLSLGLVFVSVILTWVWARRTHTLFPPATLPPLEPAP